MNINNLYKKQNYIKNTKMMINFIDMEKNIIQL